MSLSCAEKKGEKRGDERRYSSDYILEALLLVELYGDVKVIFRHTRQHENIISITEHRGGSVMKDGVVEWNCVL